MSKDINKYIELRSEKVRNIVGKIPPRLLRVGISTISLIILITLVIAYFIPYPQYKVYAVKIYSQPITQIVAAPESGVASIDINSNNVLKGQQVCTLRLNPDSIIRFYSNISGQLLYNCNNENYIEQKNIIFTIIPDSIDSIYGICYIPCDEISNIKKGMEITISSAGQILTGYISEIYPIIEVNSTTKIPAYKIKIEFSDPILSDMEKLLFLQKMEKKGKILVSNKPILRSILNLN